MSAIIWSPQSTGPPKHLVPPVNWSIVGSAMPSALGLVSFGIDLCVNLTFLTNERTRETFWYCNGVTWVSFVGPEEEAPWTAAASRRRLHDFKYNLKHNSFERLLHGLRKQYCLVNECFINYRCIVDSLISFRIIQGDPLLEDSERIKMLKWQHSDQLENFSKCTKSSIGQNVNIMINVDRSQSQQARLDKPGVGSKENTAKIFPCMALCVASVCVCVDTDWTIGRKQISGKSSLIKFASGSQYHNTIITLYNTRE